MDKNERNYWVWWDKLLEEWFYTDVSLDETPGLRDQLKLEHTHIHQVSAHTGVAAVEKVCPGFRKGRHEKVTQDVARSTMKH